MVEEVAAADYNLRILAPIARFFRDRSDEATLLAICEHAGIAPSDFDDAVRWITHAQFEGLLAATRERLPSDEALMEACTHRSAEAYGPLRFLTWATTPALVFAGAPRVSRFFSTVGKFELSAQGPNFAHLRYRSTRPESRLICLSRQAQLKKAPTLWGLPAAFCREVSCIGRGDDCCEYQFYWFSARRWSPAIVGLAVGVAIVAALWGRIPLSWFGFVLPLLGAAVGHILELGLTQKANNATQQEVTDALRAIVVDDAEARRELLALHERQRGWTHILEEEAAARNAALQRVFTRREQARDTALRGFSHDLRNPLAIVVGNVALLADRASVLEGDDRELVRDLQHATEQMSSMLGGLMEIASSERGLIELMPERFEVKPLSERLRRRLRALVHGRDVHVSVFSTREAPEAIQIDPVLFDRVVDNLLTNAAKYTDAGSIVVEVDGKPGFLVLKVSDTGRGIVPQALERIFRAGGSDATQRARNSYGVGLSVVVGLLDQIGGKLEVMSKVGSGTTFWICFPVTSERHRIVANDSHDDEVDSVLSRVVNIRRTAG